ncbi:beta-N-acetylhexosaminidase [Marinilabiliaceae bacterium JC017]|nr:beta-N-acetylhexosaminidase [Marinilabiliaceae bacterium JC017]
MRNQTMLLFLALILATGCTDKFLKKKELNIIPIPAKIVQNEEIFTFSANTTIQINSPQLLAGIEVFQSRMKSISGKELPIANELKEASKNTIQIQLKSDLPEEGYELDIDANRIKISASTPNGVFYAFQTILQLCPAEVFSPETNDNFQFKLPGLKIEDQPQFKWRGMMLDVSRHFYSKEEVLKLIDQLAQHKINVFHWHLVDDQGWRIEIKKYPKLAKIGAWRVDREHLPWNSRPLQKQGENATYGGYYTQEEIKEVVKYASKRFITVVPEIEMPGHTTSSLAAYPEFSCTDGPFSVIPGGIWPITDIYCAGKEETFAFLEDVLTEVMSLFPSKYIHIGGDEANKKEWKKCANCQARIKNEKLTNEHELQSYFIKRIERFISDNGRILLGWDEILEGGLAPGATVMSWRGFEGGIEAAMMGHDVVMTPTSHCYLDYYQGPMNMEPEAFNGYIPLHKTYSFNPVPDELTDEEALHILGGQGNLWTEHVPVANHMYYMTFPRMAAISEALWSPLQKRNWSNFIQRLENHFKVYDIQGINYAKSIYTVEFDTQFDETSKKVKIELKTEAPGKDIYYTLDGTIPNQTSIMYEKPFVLDESTEIKAQVYEENQPKGDLVVKDIKMHKGIAKSIKYLCPYSEKFPGSGKYTLNNCLRGSKNFNDKKWLGYEGNNLEIVYDLNQIEEINKVLVGCLHNVDSWIFLPKEINVWASNDGKTFNHIAKTTNELPLKEKSQIVDFELNLNHTRARFFKIEVKNQGQAPKWHNAAGSDVWLFVDEIILE